MSFGQLAERRESTRYSIHGVQTARRGAAEAQSTRQGSDELAAHWRVSMKKVLMLTVALATTLSLGGCYTPEDRAVGGAALGGATGALIGGAASGTAGGALAGGLIGAAAGGIIGANTTPAPPPPRCAEFDIDPYGRRYCVAWYH
jgi:hypothetical protein